MSAPNSSYKVSIIDIKTRQKKHKKTTEDYPSWAQTQKLSTKYYQIESNNM